MREGGGDTGWGREGGQRRCGGDRGRTTPTGGEGELQNLTTNLSA